MDEGGNVSDNKSAESVTPCLKCSAGVMHLSYITYFAWLDEELITVPNFPAWLCDICGQRKYDPRAIAWLSILLNPGRKRAPEHRQRFEDGLSGIDIS